MKIVALISGRGSNLQAMIQAAAEGLPIEIAAVISNNPEALGLQLAKRAGIPTHILPHTHYPSREIFDQAMIEIIDPYAPEWIVLAGFMRQLSEVFVKHYPRRILNIHPSLLPLYPGLNTHKRALENQEKIHGASIHLVDLGLDTGPILAQAQVPIEAGETSLSLAEKVLKLENQMYPQLLGWLATGELMVSGTEIRFADQELPAKGIQISFSIDPK